MTLTPQFFRWSDGRSSLFVRRTDGVLLQIGFLANGCFEAFWECG